MSEPTDIYTLADECKNLTRKNFDLARNLAAAHQRIAEQNALIDQLRASASPA